MIRSRAILAGLAMLWLLVMVWATIDARQSVAMLRAVRADRSVRVARGDDARLAMRWPAAIGLHARDRASAMAMVTRSIRQAGAGVTLTRVEAVADGAPAIVRYAVSAHGPGDALLGFVSALERARPGLRFDNFALIADEGGRGMRLDGTVITLWQAP